MKKLLKKTFLEMIPVILGILIALFINGWKERVDNRQFIQTMMENVTKELEENRKELEDVIPEHDRFSDTIYAHINDDVTVLDLVNLNQGISAPTIKITTWKALQNQNLKLIDFELISLLSRIEENQEYQNLKVRKLMDFLYEHGASSDSERKKIFNLIIDDLSAHEESLLDLHDTYFEEHKTNSKSEE